MKSKSEIAALLYTILEALHAAKTSPLGGVPNGELYAQLMGHINLMDWNLLIDGMKDGNVRDKGPLITQQNFLLKITERGEFVLCELETIYNAAIKTQEAK